MAPTASDGRSVVLPARESDSERSSTPVGPRVSCILLSVALLLTPAAGEGAAPSSERGETLSVGELTERYGPAVVLIRVKMRDEGVTRLGSGFLIDGSGTLVTALHLLEGAEKVLVKTADGEKFERIDIRAHDAESDLAILQVSGRDLPVAPLGESDTVEAGDAITVIGNPIGLARTVTEGIVSAWRQHPPMPEDIEREEKEEDEEFGPRRRIRALPNIRFLQIAVAISPGSSGAPVFDRGGKVIGMAVGGFAYGMADLNFAIPTSLILPLLEVDQRMTLDSLHEQVERDREDQAEPHLENARLALELEDDAEALREIDAALQLSPDSVEGLILESELLERWGDLDGAEVSLRRATERDPESIEAWSRLGELLLRRGRGGNWDRVREAKACFDQVMELDSEHAGAAQALGEILSKEGRFESAGEMLQRAVEIDPEVAAAQILLGETLLQLDQVQRAEDAFRAALEVDPESAVAHRGLAIASFRLGQDGLARDHIGVFLDLSEREPELEALRERTILFLRRYPTLMPLKYHYLLKAGLLRE